MSRNSHNISEIGRNYFHVTSDETSELSSKKVISQLTGRRKKIGEPLENFSESKIIEEILARVKRLESIIIDLGGRSRKLSVISYVVYLVIQRNGLHD